MDQQEITYLVGDLVLTPEGTGIVFAILGEDSNRTISVGFSDRRHFKFDPSLLSLVDRPTYSEA